MPRVDLISVVIPSYNPSEGLLTVVKDVKSKGFHNIIIINDGSDSSYLSIFDQVKSIEGCIVLNHETNFGKGRALKTGMAYFLDNYPDSIGIVTIDDDGQHLPDDILSCAQTMAECGALVLGVRDLKAANVPPKSRFGNSAMIFLFKFATGMHITDTQTGLRAIPRQCLPSLLKVAGDRFEYETKALLAAKDEGFEIRQVPIKTVYIDGNRATHFRAFKDSFIIIFQFAKYIAGSLLSFAIDFLGFLALLKIFGKGGNPDSWDVIFISTAIARIVSSIVNFLFNKNIVFKYKNKSVPRAAFRYFILWCFTLIMSSQLVALISLIPIINTAALIAVVKIIIDSGLFIANYFIQRRWVFK